MKNNKFLLLIIYMCGWAFSLHSNSPVLWAVPEKQSYLIKRDGILNKIKDSLYNNLPVMYLTGIPGIGKTQLAKLYAHESYNDYDIVWWFDCGSDLQRQFVDLATSLNQVNKDKSEILNIKNVSPQRLVFLVNNNLRRSSHSCLLIFDNVKNIADIKDFLPKFSNEKKKHILLTSQKNIKLENQIITQKLQRNESIALLSKITGKINNAGATSVAEILSDYPLAIRQAAFFLKANPTISFQNYVDLFKDQRNNLWNQEEISMRHYLENSDENEDYDKTLRASLKLSLQDIKKQLPDAFNLLVFMSLLETIGIPERLLQSWCVLPPYKWSS